MARDFKHRNDRGGWRAARRLISGLAAAAIVVAAIIMAGGLVYWLGLPAWPRQIAGGVCLIGIPALWFWPGRFKCVRRIFVVGVLTVFFAHYYTKDPIDRDWVALHENNVSAEILGDTVTLHHFRDAIHRIDEPAEVRWTTQTFQLSELEGADFIVQPFGDSPIMVHIFMSFRFSDGRHVAASVEARRTDWNTFDPVAGFFRHFEAYLVLGTERDLVWQRLARDEPYTMYFHELTASRAVTRRLFVGLLDYANDLEAAPHFYDTLEESCFTGLVKHSPDLSARIHGWDLRRWIPGYATNLLQDIGAVDDSVSPKTLRQRDRLRDGIRSPSEFASDPEWSAYLRSGPHRDET